MEELTSESFEIATKGDAIVDFWAPWCGPCKTQGPILESTSGDHQNITFYKVNVDEEPGIASTFDVRGIPTLLFIKNGQIVDKHSGVLDKDALKQKIVTHYS